MLCFDINIFLINYFLKNTFSRNDLILCWETGGWRNVFIKNLPIKQKLFSPDLKQTLLDKIFS